MIGSINLNSTPQTGGAEASEITSTIRQASEDPSSQRAPGTKAGGTQTVSTLGRQLAASAIRADEREKILTRSQLVDKAKSIQDYIVGDSYFANKSIHDSEIPNSSDPELLSRAKQATAFVTDATSGGHSIKNPFSGLSQEQLSNIMYDDSGTYTVNERHAASRESYDQEQVWRRKVSAQAMAEYNNTGKLTNFFKAVLDHFKELPAIEQTQYPKDYATNLESKIGLDFNYRTHQAEGKGEGPMSLIEMLFEQSLQQTNSGFHDKDSIDSPTA